MKPIAIQILERKLEDTTHELERLQLQQAAIQQWLPLLQVHPDAEIRSISFDHLELEMWYYNYATSELAYLPSYANIVAEANNADSDGPVIYQTIPIAPKATLTIVAHFNWEPSDCDLLRALGNLTPTEPREPSLVLTCRT